MRKTASDYKSRGFEMGDLSVFEPFKTWSHARCTCAVERACVLRLDKEPHSTTDRSHGLSDSSLTFPATVAPFPPVLTVNAPDLSKTHQVLRGHPEKIPGQGGPQDLSGRGNHLEEALQEDKAGSSPPEDPKAGKCTGVGYLGVESRRKRRTWARGHPGCGSSSGAGSWIQSPT